MSCYQASTGDISRLTLNTVNFNYSLLDTPSSLSPRPSGFNAFFVSVLLLLYTFSLILFGSFDPSPKVLCCPVLSIIQRLAGLTHKKTPHSTTAVPPPPPRKAV